MQVTNENLSPCPFCNGKCHTTKGWAEESVWAYGSFYRVFCGDCQVRQLFHRTEKSAIKAWNKWRAAADLNLEATAELDSLLSKWAAAVEDGVTSHETIRDKIISHIRSSVTV